jgi:hypothetical protein
MTDLHDLQAFLKRLEQGQASLAKIKKYRSLVKEIETLLSDVYEQGSLSPLPFEQKEALYNQAKAIQAKMYPLNSRFDQAFSKLIDHTRPYIEQAADGEITEERMVEEMAQGAVGVTEAGEIDQLIQEAEALKQEASEIVSHLSQEDTTD